MLYIKDTAFGEVQLEIDVGRSAVDSFIQEGFSLTYDRELTEDELEYLQDRYPDEIFEYSMENGSRRPD